MKEIAKKFYDFGLNILVINNQLNENNYGDGNTMKAPSSKIYLHERQTINDFNNLNWDSLTGFGVWLGYDSLCAIDIDGVLDENILDIICSKLHLPKNYEWIFKSGSQCGYHILLKCALPQGLKQTQTTSSFFLPSQDSIPYDFGTLDTNAYYPSTDAYGRYHQFYKIEFKWKGNIVLPPSLHQSGNNYSFLNGFPVQQPNLVDFKDLLNVKALGCIQAKSSVFDFDKQTSYHLTYADSIPYNFESNIKESGLVFNICQFPVHNSPVQPLFMNQISWFVIDSNYNIIKRHCFNYYCSNNHSTLYCNTIDIDTSMKLIHHNRFVYHEFLFDLIHVKEIICWDMDNIGILKKEIMSAGLYLDPFLKKFTLGEGSFDCELFKDYINEENLKPIILIQNLLVDYKIKPVIEYFRNRFEDSLLVISNMENKLCQYKYINSISYLTAIYTLYLLLKTED